MGKISSQKKIANSKLIVKNLNKTNLLLLYFVSLCLFEAIWAGFAILSLLFNEVNRGTQRIVSVEYLFERPVIASNFRLGKCHLELS